MEFRLLLLVCPVEGEGVASEVNDVLAEVKLLVDVPHRCGLGVHALEGLGVVLVKVGHKDQELPKPPLLEHPHQVWKQIQRASCCGMLRSRADAQL